MDNTIDMVRDTVARLLSDTVTPARTMAAEPAGIDTALWSAFAELGLRGGEVELDLETHMAVLQEAGRAAALVPYAESEVLGRWLESAAGISPHEGTLAVLPEPVQATAGPGDSLELSLQGRIVPWGRHASRILAVCDAGGAWRIAELEPAALQLRHDANMAGEPRDVVTSGRVSVPASRVHAVQGNADVEALFALGALCRTASMVGALSAANELALQYSQDRKQFGKPISQFQVIQSYLAEMAAEVCAAALAHDLGVAGAMSGNGWGDAAVAKVRAGHAVRTVTRLAHQIHGAIGMTQEYPLHVWTRRLWSWREEFGDDRHWGAELGRSLIASGADMFWPRMTGDALSLSLSPSRRDAGNVR